MRNSTDISISQTPSSSEETTWTFSGAFLGFIAWLLVLGIPFLLYGSNSLFFLLYTWPFFLALMPVAIIIGITWHSLLAGRFIYSCIATLFTVGLIFGMLFMWLMG